MRELTNEQKADAVRAFIKDAFCIDGEVELVFEPMEFDTHFRCHDSKRGVMIVGMEKE